MSFACFLPFHISFCFFSKILFSITFPLFSFKKNSLLFQCSLFYFRQTFTEDERGEAIESSLEDITQPPLQLVRRPLWVQHGSRGIKRSIHQVEQEKNEEVMEEEESWHEIEVTTQDSQIRPSIATSHIEKTQDRSHEQVSSLQRLPFPISQPLHQELVTTTHDQLQSRAQHLSRAMNSMEEGQKVIENEEENEAEEEEEEEEMENSISIPTAEADKLALLQRLSQKQLVDDMEEDED